MDDHAIDRRPRPGVTRSAQADHEARMQREAAALRENLRRRKAQRRNRSELAAEPGISLEANQTEHKLTEPE